MKPDVDRVLGMLATALMGEIAPKIADHYTQQSALMMAMLLSSIPEEWDRAAARRVEENRALRELFGDAAPEVASSELREKLRASAREKEGSLRIRDLEHANHALRRLLIELHAHLEELDSPAARSLEGRIWEELRRSTQRRALAMAPF